MHTGQQEGNKNTYRNIVLASQPATTACALSVRLSLKTVPSARVLYRSSVTFLTSNVSLTPAFISDHLRKNRGSRGSTAGASLSNLTWISKLLPVGYWMCSNQ